MMSSLRGSYRDDIGSLLRELDMVEQFANSQAPGVMSFKNEISQMKYDAHTLMSRVTDMEMHQSQRRWVSPEEIDGISRAIQYLTNRIIFFKRHMNVFKQHWQQSPMSDQHYYSSSDSMTPGSAPRRMRFGGSKAAVSTNPFGLNSAGGGFSSAQQPQPPEHQFAQPLSPPLAMSAPTQSNSQQSNCSCNSRYHGGRSNYMEKCILCWFKRYNPAQLWQIAPPPHYAFPARPFM